jgi:hypothetical protein
MRLAHRLGVMTVALVAAIGPVAVSTPAVAGAPVTGAIYTTDMGCTGVDLNIYGAKTDVYLDGGPRGGGGSLPDGMYYVQVTEPDGTPLGVSVTAVVEVSGGEFAACYQLVDIVYAASSMYTVKGFDTTSNPGGVYKVWVSQDPTFPSNLSKTDNFKVMEQPESGTIEVLKFYDADGDGVKAMDEPYIDGWKVNIHDDLYLDRFTPVSVVVLGPDTYYVSEYAPVQMNWYRSAPAPFAYFEEPVTVMLEPGETETVVFGNYCTVDYVGKTLGFWSNKNGGSLLPPYLAGLRGLHLVKADGTAFDPVTVQSFQSWLRNASATNMASMLSAQMAATWLNVQKGWVPGDAVVLGTGMTVNELLAAADASLSMYPVTLAGHPQRMYQEMLKDTFDAINNSWAKLISPTVCPFTFAE